MKVLYSLHLFVCGMTIPTVLYSRAVKDVQVACYQSAIYVFLFVLMCEGCVSSSCQWKVACGKLPEVVITDGRF